MVVANALLKVANEESQMITQAELLLDEVSFASSDIQLCMAVIAVHGDNHSWGMYLQALREVQSRVQTLRTVHHDIEQLQIREERHRILGARWAFTRLARLKRKEDFLAADACRDQIRTLSRSYNDTQAELNILMKRVGELRKTFGDLTPGVRRNLELDYWAHRIVRIARLGLATTGRIDASILQLLSVVDGPLKDRLGDLFHNLPEAQRCYLEACAAVDTGPAIANQ